PILRVIRENPKKCAAGALAAGWLANWLYTRQAERAELRQHCRWAKAFGDAPVSGQWQQTGQRRPQSQQQQQPRRVTVLFNPRAAQSAWFEKALSPMLHLAGFEVQLVEGDAEDENKGFMEVLDLNSTDAVLVAGGDGTLMQAVTGLLRRPDSRRIAARLPVAAAPLGRRSDSTSTVSTGVGGGASPAEGLPEACRRTVEALLQATSANFNNTATTTKRIAAVRPMRVRVRLGGDSELPRDTYCLTALEWSSLRQRERATEASAIRRNLPTVAQRCLHWLAETASPSAAAAVPVGCVIDWTPACPGCARCVAPAPARSLSSRLLSVSQRPSPAQQQQQLATASVNPDCGQWRQLEVPATLGIRLSPTPTGTAGGVLLQVLPARLSGGQLWRAIGTRLSGGDSSTAAARIDQFYTDCSETQLLAGGVSVRLLRNNEAAASAQQPTPEELEKQKKKETPYFLDNELFDPVDVQVSLSEVPLLLCA
ncbi:hypothetical protein BOX15_Mlig007375g6, partial [Macrostomum lignano]